MSLTTRELLLAAATGDVNRLRALLQQGVDVNSTNQAKQTALMLAAAFKHQEVIKLLLAAGADVGKQDELGFAASDWANQEIEIIDLLDVPGAEPTAVRPTPVFPPALSTKAAAAGPALTGLAAAIFRDRNPQESSEPVSTLEDQRYDYSDNETTIDETLDRPVTAAADDTLSPAKHRPSHRVNLNSATEAPKSITQVDIPIPQPLPRTNNMRTFLRAALVILLMGVVFVGYNLMSSLMTPRPSNGLQTNPSAPPPIVQADQPVKGPVVGGELVGTELFVPDVEYPSDATAEGNVTVNIKVSRKGIVVGARPADGDETLHAAAEKAAKSSAFDPEKLKDKSPFVNGTITYNFNKHKPAIEKSSESGVFATTGGPLAGTELKLALPQIPPSLKGQSGSMTIVVRVSKSGKVMSWRPVTGDQRLRSAAIKAARSSTFSPEKLPGSNQVVGLITYSFQ